MNSVVNDPLYGPIPYSPVERVFLNAAPMQRLRQLHQMDTVNHIYPSASHTRFEHSLGCMHLALKLLESIERNHKTLGIPLCIGWDTSDEKIEDREITPSDRHCVAIAALCHNIGHGPFSCLFEGLVHDNNPEALAGERYFHKVMGIRIVESIWEKNKTTLEQQFGLNDKDLNFVKVLMKGLEPEEKFPVNDVGRSAWKRFMVDIVTNKVHGIDVDKLDSLERDHYNIHGIRPSIQIQRIFYYSCVIPVDKDFISFFGQTRPLPSQANFSLNENDIAQYRICFADKVRPNITEIGSLERKLHSQVYDHRVAQIVNCMIKDILALCWDIKFIHTINKEGEDTLKSLSESLNDVEVYCKTGEGILNSFLNMYDKDNKKLNEAQEIIKRLFNRKFYINVFISGLDYLSTQGLISDVESDLKAEDTYKSLHEKLEMWKSNHSNKSPLVTQSVFFSGNPQTEKCTFIDHKEVGSLNTSRVSRKTSRTDDFDRSPSPTPEDPSASLTLSQRGAISIPKEASTCSNMMGVDEQASTYTCSYVICRAELSEDEKKILSTLFKEKKDAKNTEEGLRNGIL